MKLKQIVCAALSAALLSSTALAVTPVIAPPIAPAPPAFTIHTRTASPILVYGKATELGENKVTLENDNKSDPYQKIVANLTDDTLVLDAVTGAKKAFADLKKGESLYAYVSPMMTRSIPPISNAALILCNLPADFAAPTFAEIQSITTDKDGVVTATTDRDVIYHIGKDTKFIAAPGAEKAATAADLKVGTKVLAWYQIVALSMPAQASPTSLMVFPYTYSGVLAADATSVTVNGTPVTLTAAEQPQIQDGKLLLPVRKVAEALGCKVLWDAKTPNIVTVQQADKTLYTLATDTGTAAQPDSAFVGLTAPITLLGGVTFMTADDLLFLHNLKLDSGAEQMRPVADAVAPAQ